MTFAAFVISTGRCGTQWLAAALAEGYSDLIKVEHEPLHDQYEARKALASRVTSGMPARHPAAVVAHLGQIERHLETSHYVECGHPCWSTIPSIARQFSGRIRIVHLTRHPVPTCYSWLTHRAFQPPLMPYLPVKTLLSPFDDGVAFTEYQSRWDMLTPFEKCLYYWSEVNAFAIDLRTRLDVPWLQLRSEDLFEGDGLRRLQVFLDLPDREWIMPRKGEVIDQHQSLSADWQDWRIIESHPRAIEIARQLGYSLEGIDEATLRRRYLGLNCIRG